MAQISSISNGEAMSSVRTKLNDVITNVNLLDPTDWVDYSATSTIVGWSSFTTKQLRYRIIGKQMFVQIFLEGTSNSTSTTFTLPNQQKNINFLCPNISADNGVLKNLTYFYTVANSSTITCYQNTSATWTASGTKTVYGQFFLEIA